MMGLFRRGKKGEGWKRGTERGGDKNKKEEGRAEKKNFSLNELAMSLS